MACALDTKPTSSLHSAVCEVCTEVAEATKHCDDCLTNLCDRCAQTHEKSLWRKGTHRVEVGACSLELELCPEDGQKMSFYCRSCMVRVCPQCELSNKRHVMHPVVTLTQHVGQEKENLLDKLDDVTTKTETISYMPADIKSVSTEIELKWLERKELIRQEFASLFETITTRQKQLMADMEEEVKQSLQRLKHLQQDHETVLSSTCQLSDDCISAVQNLPRDEFMKSYPQFLESVQELENQVKKMKSAEDFMPSCLTLPFSLHKEKVHLDSCLQLKTFCSQDIKPKEYHRFIPQERLRDVLSINMLLNTPQPDAVPPSSVIRYNVEIYCGSKQNKRKPVWVSKKALRSVDNVINSSHGYKLSPGSLYMVKFHPTIICTNHQGERCVEGKVVSIVIVTEGNSGTNSSRGCAVATGDNQNSAVDTDSLLGSSYDSFHGIDSTWSLFSSAGAGNRNNSSSSNSQGQVRRTLINSKNCGQQTFPLFNQFIPRPSGFLGASFQGAFHPFPRAYNCVVPNSAIECAFPVKQDNETLQCQQRYIACCSFEEARLMEYTTLGCPGRSSLTRD